MSCGTGFRLLDSDYGLKTDCLIPVVMCVEVSDRVKTFDTSMEVNVSFRVAPPPLHSNGSLNTATRRLELNKNLVDISVTAPNETNT